MTELREIQEIRSSACRALEWLCPKRSKRLRVFMACQQAVRSSSHPYTASGFSPALALFFVLALGAKPILPQSTPPQADLQSRIEQAARELAGEPRLKELSDQKRQELVEFVAGNTLFALVHEMGHALVTEMGLPVLGREEDAADAFATQTMLKMGTAFADGVLLATAKGWFLSARRDEKEGVKLAFYDEHGLDKQRAYYIVCLMVGSNPEKFKVVADQVNLPEERQGTCQADYSNASWSWDKALEPHRRTPEQPKTKIDVIYGEGEGMLNLHAKSFRHIRLLEPVAEHAANEFVWRAPFALEMRTCGESGASWDLPARTIFICYELAAEFAQLYRDYAPEWRPTTGYRPR